MPGESGPIFELLAASSRAGSESETLEALLRVHEAALRRDSDSAAAAPAAGGDLVDEVMCSAPRTVSWEPGLCDVVASAFRCLAYVTEVLQPGGWTWVDLHHVLGEREDVSTAAAVFVIAREAALRLGADARDAFVERLADAFSDQVVEKALDPSPPDPVLAAAQRLGIVPL